MNHAKILSVVTSLWLMTACSLPGGEVPADHFYRLPPVAPDAAQALTRKLHVNQVRASGIYHERAMLYVEATEPQEIKRYNYHFWMDSPANMLHTWFSSRLNSTTATNNADAMQLNLHVLNFERLLIQDGADAFVRLRLDVMYPAKSGVAFTTTYTARVSATSLALPDTARAFGEALESIAQAIERDLTNI